ncbi:MAG: type II toxin-antitoxin system PemK/MazF family toxin [Candidatus Aminicenantes bacterium]|nr:type II toxin-antitoxin system PemK/MazF family toxin [Candidatus Aminicenantes bacterium]
MVMNRGEIWWATLPVPSGSEPGFRRPLLIIQSDTFNRSRISTVIAVVITSNLKLSEAPGNVVLSRKNTGLPKKSVANVSQIVTIDKSFLSKRAGILSPDILKEVDAGIRLALSV